MKLNSLTKLSVFHSILLLHVIPHYSMSLITPQRSAITTAINVLTNETDRLALLKIKGSVSDDPYGAMSSWNDSVRFCEWLGVSCSIRHQRVTVLDLEGYSLRGTISPFIGNLSFLRFINLGNNSFSGEIPQQVGRLSRLRHLNLTANVLEGKIPLNLSLCSQLRMLNLGNNRLGGTIPSELGSLDKLVSLHLRANTLTGGIPASLANISSLSEISAAYNNLTGSFPSEFGRSNSLTLVSLGINNLSGVVPLSLFNISSMRFLNIAGNRFRGSLPFNIGLTLPNLRVLYAADNNLSGIIPESFSNASQLQQLDIGYNNFFGKIPNSFGNLLDLTGLFFGENSLGNYSAHSLDFIDHLTNCSKLEIVDFSRNQIGGNLPNSVTNLSTGLTMLYLGLNQISGAIPTGLDNLKSLIILHLRDNLFTGVIPASLGNLPKLQHLSLSSNMLSGQIPSSLGNLTHMFKLYLTHNKLEGAIPPAIGGCEMLQYLDMSKNSLSGAIPRELFLRSSYVFLDLSQNSLTGNLPAEVGKQKNIYAVNLSENHLTGRIPETIRGCENLEYLFLQGNSFQGTLSSALASLTGLQYLDLSRNNLTGKIPRHFEKLRYLQVFNLSFNDLEGELPSNGIFQNISVITVVGNAKLCGGVHDLQLPRCPSKEFKSRRTKGHKLTIAIVSAVAVTLLFFGFIVFFWRRKSQKKSADPLSKISFLSKVPYKRLYQATNGFSPNMLIGIGSFGSVYKGILDQEENLVAVKVLNLQQKGADKSFFAECNALRNIRHRNLVKVLTCCSSVDYSGNEFKALVFEYMSNGSLDKWLHLVPADENRTRGLGLIQRLNIVIDVASAMYYLHEDCDQPIIHRDLKPSNVLLDDEMSAHVSDFGLARLISSATGYSEGQASSMVIKGTIGYAAPEYAMGGEPSKQGDVYSYGILVLEMFTGKRPTEEMFKDDFNLHSFVNTALPEKLEQVVDSALLAIDNRQAGETALKREDGGNDIVNEDIEFDIEEANVYDSENPNQISSPMQKCLISALEIGIACSKESPSERMIMGDVTKGLHHIRKAYMMGIGVHGQRQRQS